MQCDKQSKLMFLAFEFWNSFLFGFRKFVF